MSSDSIVLQVVLVILIILFLYSGLVLRMIRKRIEEKRIKIPLIGAKSIFSFERKKR